MSDAKIETMVMITGREYEALRAEVERLKTSGIAEVAAHNPSVMDWIHHWERRTLKAEAENEKLRAALKKINVGDGWAALIARAALEEKQ